MKRLAGIFIAAALFIIPNWTQAAERVVQLSATITVSRSGVVAVQETITYDFGEAERHGIYRLIPTKVENRRTPVKVVNVGIDGAPSDRYVVSSESGYARVRIGNPDRTITGEHRYLITYQVRNAINWFDGQPELYWNITGNGWDVPIEHAVATINEATGATVDNIKCYTGAVASQATDCTIRAAVGGGVEVIAPAALSANEGLTVVARLSADAVPEPTAWQRFASDAAPNLGYGLPALALIALIWIQLRLGRDPKGRGTIIAEYEPPTGLSPAMLGYLIDEQINSRDVTASIIDLAVKGTLKISYEDQALWRHTYRLIKTGEPSATLTQFERELHTALFSVGDSVTLKDLQKALPGKLSGLKKTLRDEAKQQQYFKDLSSARGKYLMAVGVLGGLAWIAWMADWVGWTVGLAVSAGLTLIFMLPFLQQRSGKGVAVTEQIKGFKLFLSVTDKDRLKFHNAPAVKPEQFMAFLPFAIALGVEKDWAKQFEHITIEQPDWYQGNWTAFNAAVFASSLSDFAKTTAAQGLASAASGGSGFSGGGFSGGGFGGGGGGSW
ncbi:MAG: DUF2207 domain-containing protein [Candidatus Kerfeldbacteria bacterium]|nr:DUF2207 domain-containing protein [Candidatus Kerfeldbacteria bacterium]